MSLAKYDELIGKHTKMDGVDIRKLSIEIANKLCGMNDWGSSQYKIFQALQSIQSVLMADHMMKSMAWQNNLSKPLHPDLSTMVVNSLPIPDVISYLDLDIRWSDKRTEEETVELFRTSQIDYEKKHEMIYPYKYSKECLDILQNKSKFETVADCFEFAKNHIWDLWNVAPRLCNCAFKDLHVPKNLDIVGVYCFLLVQHGYVEYDEHEKVFGKIDT